jgi:CHAT domain-containing protein
VEGEISGHSAELLAQAQPVTLERVQRVIPTNTALVEIVSYSPDDLPGSVAGTIGKWTPRYAAYVLRREGEPVFVDLGEARPINRAVVRFRAVLADPKSTDVKRAARALDELVMRPVRRLLGETRTVLLSPDGDLHLVPFAALVDEHGQYLLENYTFTYLTSGRDLLRLGAPSRQRQLPLVIANPSFDLAVTTGPQEEAMWGRRSLDLNVSKVDSLPGTAQAAAAIKRVVPEAGVLIGREATEAALKQVAGPRILHIATHGFYLTDQLLQAVTATRQLNEPAGTARGENPLLRSGLVLAGVKKGQSGAGEDGVLTALEVSSLDLWGTKLVALSACETGLGDVENGEGVYGLRRALVLAGSETQVMSLWKVSDAGTRDLMVAYYTLLQQGVGRAEALRHVQLAMLRGQLLPSLENAPDKRKGKRETGEVAGRGAAKDYRHSYYWAANIPSGDWRSLAEQKR